MYNDVVLREKVSDLGCLGLYPVSPTYLAGNSEQTDHIPLTYETGENSTASPPLCAC